MTGLRKSSSLASLNDVDLSEIMSPKQSISDRICGLINYITLVPTLIYNLVWIYLLTSELNSSFKEESSINQEDNNCNLLKTNLLSIYSWCFVSIIKSFFFLCCANFVCGGENECNVFCLVIKAIFSFFPSVYFMYHLDYTNNINIMQVEKCHNMWNYVNTFFKMERGYVYVFVTLLVLIPIGTILVACKELWKSRKYHEF